MKSMYMKLPIYTRGRSRSRAVGFFRSGRMMKVLIEPTASGRITGDVGCRRTAWRAGSGSFAPASWSIRIPE